MTAKKGKGVVSGTPVVWLVLVCRLLSQRMGFLVLWVGSVICAPPRVDLNGGIACLEFNQEKMEGLPLTKNRLILAVKTYSEIVLL